MSESIWKKELSFSRKAKAPKPEPEPEPEQAVEQAVEPAVQAKQSIWKKEISLGGKSKQPKQPKQPQAEAEPKQPLWKKDVSLSRKKKKKDDEAVARLVELATRAVAPDFEAAPAEALAPPTQVAEAVLAAQPAEPVADPVADVHPVELLPVDAPAAELPLAPVAEVPLAPTVAEPVGVALEPEPVAAEPVVAVPVAAVAEPEPVVAAVVPEPAVEPAPAVETAPAPVAYHVEAGPVEDWMEPQPVEPWLAEPALPPAPEAETAVVVHPPVAAAELPPLAASKTPFWKKELSLSRKQKGAAPAAPALTVPGSVHPPVPASELPPLPELKQPFWKKELSLSKKQQKAPNAQKAPKEPKAAGQPFWKKELSLSKRPKAEQAEPVAQAGPTPKRSRSLPSFSLPQLSLSSLSRGGGGGHHQVKRLVGLKIGGSQLAAARIANNGAAELLQVARADLAPGVVVAGELRDPDSLAEALKAFFAANKLPRKNVRLGIASNRIGVRTFDLAGITDPKQLENAVHFRAQETLPIPLDEAVLDYQVLEERVDDEGNPTKRVLLVVAYRELVDRYVSACKKAGITLSGIDLEAFALLRALSAPRTDDQPSDSALVAVAVGHDRSTFAVSDGRVCEFTRVLEWGGASLNVAIARALDLAPSETEGIKRAVSLSSPEVPQGISPEHYALAVDAVRKQVQGFARELVSSLQFYQNQPGSLGIGEIVITGGTANLAGIADELQRLIGVHVRVGDPLARLKLTKKLTVDDQVGSLAVAIGLGIED